MTSDELRATAAQFAEIAKNQTDQHVRVAGMLAGTLTASDRVAMEALAGVSDCMARRYRQWAMHIDAAANEIDELSPAPHAS